MKPDYFAVLRPNLRIVDDDLSRLNVLHCRYLMGLGQLPGAAAAFEAVLPQDALHAGAPTHTHLQLAALRTATVSS